MEKGTISEVCQTKSDYGRSRGFLEEDGKNGGKGAVAVLQDSTNNSIRATGTARVYTPEAGADFLHSQFSPPVDLSQGCCLLSEESTLIKADIEAVQLFS